MFTHLIALNPGGQQIVKVAIADGAVTPIIAGLTAFPDGIVVDSDQQHIYWTNMGCRDCPPTAHPAARTIWTSTDATDPSSAQPLTGRIGPG